MKPQSLNIKTLTYYKEENLETKVPYEYRCKNLKWDTNIKNWTLQYMKKKVIYSTLEFIMK